MTPYYEIRPDEIFAFKSDNPYYPQHMHIQLEMMLMLDGCLHLYADQKEYLVQKGDFTLVFPNSIHGRGAADERPVQVAVAAAAPCLWGRFEHSLLRLRPQCPVLPASLLPSAVVHAFEQLLELSRKVNQGKYADLLIQSYIQIILGWCLPHLRLIPQENKGYSSIQKAVNYILKNYDQPITLESTAEAAEVGKHHLSAAFSRHMHMGFNQYVNHVRLHSATEDLRYTDKSITEIAYSSGFGSLRTFNRLFSDCFHQTPSAYRQFQSKDISAFR